MEALVSKPEPYPGLVMVFPEGPGFIFLCVVANTPRSRIMIVRSMKDFKLYIRKETRRYGSRITEFRQRVEMIALGSLQPHPNLAKPIGVTEYQDSMAKDKHSKRIAVVTYYEYYNAGTLGSLRSDPTELAKLSEYHVWGIFSQLLDAMVHCIQIGLLYTDPPLDNCFLNVGSDASLQVIFDNYNNESTIKMPANHHIKCGSTRCVQDCEHFEWFELCHKVLVQYVCEFVKHLEMVWRQTTDTTFAPTPGTHTDIPHECTRLATCEVRRWQTGIPWLAEIVRLNDWIKHVYKTLLEDSLRVRVPLEPSIAAHLRAYMFTTITRMDDHQGEIMLTHPVDALNNESVCPRFFRFVDYDEKEGTIRPVEKPDQRAGFVKCTEWSGSPLFDKWSEEHIELRAR